MELYAIKFGESQLDEKYIYRDVHTDEKTLISWSYYLAKYGSKTILFDVGFRDQAAADQWGITLFDVEEEIREVADLNQVDVVFITHSHFDHIDNIDLYPNSLLVISNDEYVHALQHGKEAVQERLRGENILTIQDEYIFDEKFKFKVIGGHTIGSSVIYFEENDKNYVITGDECYLCNNMLENRPVGICAKTEKNEAFIDNARQKGLIPLPYHDLNLFHTYKEVSRHIVRII